MYLLSIRECRISYVFHRNMYSVWTPTRKLLSGSKKPPRRMTVDDAARSVSFSTALLTNFPQKGIRCSLGRNKQHSIALQGIVTSSFPDRIITFLLQETSRSVAVLTEMSFSPNTCQNVKSVLNSHIYICIYIHIQSVSRLVDIIAGVISQVFVIKKVHINMCPILDGYGVQGIF